MYNNQPLLNISSEAIPDITATPDVQFSVWNSTLTVVKCAGMYYNWPMVDMPNCAQIYSRQGATSSPTQSYIFKSNGRMYMLRGVTYDIRNAFRRIDFYWSIDALMGVAYSLISAPASWRVSTVGTAAIEAKYIFSSVP